MARRRTVQSFESVWTWVYRGIQISAFVGGIVWFAFQFYTDVSTLKSTVATLTVATEKLFEGQKDTHNKLDKLLSQRNP